MVTWVAEPQISFNKGTEIEVTSDEDGFRGAWYQATIVESPPKSASKKRKKALIEYKYLVTDDGSNPLTEQIDPAFIRPLPPQKEGNEDIFEESDIVEANYRDGWWTGTVRKVLKNGKFRVYFDNPPDVLDFGRKDLRVHWEWVNGNWVRPEKQQSTGSRSIFSSGTSVEVNLDNEENLHDVWFPAIVIKENEDGTFFVKCQNSRNGDEAETIKATLDSQHIRPTPPRYVHRIYELLEKVDTSYGFGWRAGVITKVLAGGRYTVFFKHGNEDKELSHSDLRPHVEWTDGKWISKSKEVLITSDDQEQQGQVHNGPNTPELAVRHESSGPAKANSEERTPCSANIAKNQMDLSTPCHDESASCAFSPSKKKIKLINSKDNAMLSQPNIKLTDGNESEMLLSGRASRKMPKETTKKAHSGSVTPKTDKTAARGSKKPEIFEQPSSKIENPFLGKRIKIKQQKFGQDFQMADLVKGKGRSKSPAASSIGFSGKESNTRAAAEELNEKDSVRKEAEMPVIVGLKASKGIGGTQAENPSQISDEKSLKSKDQKNNLNSSGENSMPKGGGSSQRRKRGRPRKLVINHKAQDDGKEHKGAADEIVLKVHSTDEAALPTLNGVESTVSRGTSGEKTVEVSNGDCMTKEVDMAFAVVSNNMADDDRPLSTWIGSSNFEELRLSSGKTFNGLNGARERQIDILSESAAIGVKGGSTTIENQALPFVKKSPIWKTIESMEVFKIVPQKPHFRPLNETKEVYREGSAIGVMVTFAGLFEKISMLQFDDSKSIFHSTLEGLLDLEKHGFDVTVLRDRVKELLSFRDVQGQLLDESKVAEREIIEHTNEKIKLEEEMEDIRKKINELQERFESTRSRKETKDLEIARVQSNAEAINVRVRSARHDFEKLAAAPWKVS